MSSPPAFMRASANLERGFKRLALVVSLLILAMGLVATTLDAHRADMWVMGEGQKHTCLDQVASEGKAGTLSGEPFRQRLQECRELAEANPFPARLAGAMNVLAALHHVGIAPDTSEDLLFHIFDKPYTMAWIIGGSLTVVVTLLPWVAFYLFRWIGRGFRTDRPTP